MHFFFYSWVIFHCLYVLQLPYPFVCWWASRLHQNIFKGLSSCFPLGFYYSAQTTHWKRPWCWERSSAEGEEGIREWDGWMASLMWWTWTWANSGRQWGTGRPGVLQSMTPTRTRLGEWAMAAQHGALHDHFFWLNEWMNEWMNEWRKKHHAVGACKKEASFLRDDSRRKRYVRGALKDE